MTLPLTLTVQEAGAILHVGENKVLELVASGDLPAARLGMAFTLLTDDVVEYLRKEAARQTRVRRESRESGIPASIPARQRRHRRIVDLEA